MPRPRKRLTGAAGPDKKGLSEKRPKTENSENTSAKLENASLQKTSKNCDKNLSNYWLMKSEPESRLEKGVDMKFSIEDLKAQPKQIACWDGVRNYQVRREGAGTPKPRLGYTPAFPTMLFSSKAFEPTLLVSELYPDNVFRNIIITVTACSIQVAWFWLMSWNKSRTLNKGTDFLMNLREAQNRKKKI
ncbi:thymocyte nuclear protein 1 isoform X1 [Onychomys torridus]|uniref:thymocyte nuclear protein 1 isoform X1 n=1 Tax=Onychomys torridus TaxID=38674 RepID=UPI00167F21C8|nr:thymocyte nuclear protein 1 isoform X1 [Onychomys torridus]